MKFEEYLEVSAKEIEKDLDLILSEFVKKAENTNPKLKPFAQKLMEANRGGKRIRGVLCKLGYQLASSKFKVQSSKLKEITKIAAGLEILHTALLIHDDIMDQSIQRRGQDTLHQVLGGNHYGISQAISLGDVGFYLPVKVITESNFKDQEKVKALVFLSEIIINTCWGQVLDMENPSARSGQDSKDIEFIRIFKTAKYTIAGPLQIGAILAGAELDLLDKLGKFGENLGIAFQIKDDILDGEVMEVDEEASKALEYVSIAKKMLPDLTEDMEMKNLLESMCVYLVERKQ